jgi:hypothetical protein
MTRLKEDKPLAALYCIAGSVIGLLVCGAVIWAPRASRQPNLAAAHRHPTQLHQFPMQSYNGNARDPLGYYAARLRTTQVRILGTIKVSSSIGLRCIDAPP